MIRKASIFDSWLPTVQERGQAMVDMDTFLTTTYTMADAFCKRQPPHVGTPGPKASRTGSEVVTLVIFSQWARFRSERDFYRYTRACRHLAFSTLPRQQTGRQAGGPSRSTGTGMTTCSASGRRWNWFQSTDTRPTRTATTMRPMSRLPGQIGSRRCSPGPSSWPRSR